MSYFDEYRITSPYGWRTLSGRREFHTGIDLAKHHEAPIYAFTGGTVIFAGFGQPGSGFGGYGNVVAIRDKYGALHCYCHLHSYIVQVGEEVEKGKMIGRQGNTGKVVPQTTPANPAAGSHLHYEIRKTSSPKYGWIADRENNCYDPAEYLINYYAKEKAASGKFADVPRGHWAEASINKAAGSGILSGVTENKFGVGEPVTREQLAVVLDRLGLLERSK